MKMRLVAMTTFAAVTIFSLGAQAAADPASLTCADWLALSPADQGATLQAADKLPPGPPVLTNGAESEVALAVEVLKLYCAEKKSTKLPEALKAIR